MYLPNARTNEIIEQEAGSDLLIYDLRINKAYNLNETLKNVYYACCNQMTFDELKRQHKFTDDLIHFALDQLKANNLIEGEVRNLFAGLSRRDVIKRVGLGSMIAIPAIAGLIAPKAVNAQSGCVADGQSGSLASVLNADRATCEVNGYPDPACCSGVATGFLGDSGNCQDMECGKDGAAP